MFDEIRKMFTPKPQPELTLHGTATLRAMQLQHVLEAMPNNSEGLEILEGLQFWLDKWMAPTDEELNEQAKDAHDEWNAERDKEEKHR